MAEVIIYSKKMCPYCTRAKSLLDKKGVKYQEIMVDADPEQLQIMIDLTQRRTVPQIIINKRPIGGFDDMYALEQRGELDAVLSQS